MAAALRQQFDDLGPAADVSARRATERLAHGAGDDVHPVTEGEAVGDDTAGMDHGAIFRPAHPGGHDTFAVDQKQLGRSPTVSPGRSATDRGRGAVASRMAAPRAVATARQCSMSSSARFLLVNACRTQSWSFALAAQSTPARLGSIDGPALRRDTVAACAQGGMMSRHFRRGVRIV